MLSLLLSKLYFIYYTIRGHLGKQKNSTLRTLTGRIRLIGQRYT
jgi:hypothetical protein